MLITQYSKLSFLTSKVFLPLYLVLFLISVSICSGDKYFTCSAVSSNITVSVEIVLRNQQPDIADWSQIVWGQRAQGMLC